MQPIVIFYMVFLGVGFFLGMVVELLVNVRMIKRLEAENKYLREEISIKRDVKITEIHDNRDSAPEDVDLSQNW